jgi:hypothetical protein
VVPIPTRRQASDTLIPYSVKTLRPRSRSETGPVLMRELPIRFLVDCSHQALTEYELTRLNEVATLRKQIRVMTEQMVDALAAANAARWLLENRHNLTRTVISISPAEARSDPLMLDAD